MKISYNHLKTLIDFNHDPQKLGEILTGTGLEVEAIEKVDAVKGGLDGLVIGEVMACGKHPDADKLSVTKIDIGSGELLDIVCGAPNVAQGQKVIVATVGTTLYPSTGDSFVIKKSKIRGAVSEGMLCAEDEIGLGASHAGIMVLDTNLPIGTPIAKYFNLEPDYLIEIGLTPNRADAASHLGVARDIKAAGDQNIKTPDISKFALGISASSISLTVEDLEACPRFCGLEIKGIEVKESPDWLKRFLNTIGVNAINNIVDISNYVCHYLGQPMHMFDADEIRGSKIIVKCPSEGTEIVTLDGLSRKLNGTDLAICDAEGPISIAGVFGGQNSGVKPETKNVFLEVAYFNPVSIRKTSSRFSLKTDASFRYERGTDPNMPLFAIKFAALMVQELAGGEICDTLIDNYPQPIANFGFDVKIKNINRLLGKELGETLIIDILEKLDIKVLSNIEGILKVSVPPYRVDVTREADVIEEILRIYGFDNIELSENLSSDFISDFPAKDLDNLQFKLSDSLAAMGFHEIQNLSIVKPADNAWLNEGESVVKLLNPLSEELSEMRQSLLFSGLSSVLYNVNRRNKDLKFFEIGRTYNKSEVEGITKIKENKVLSLLMTGNVSAESWMQKSTAINYHHLFQVVSQVLNLMKIKKMDTNETSNAMFAYGLEHIVRNKSLVKFGLVSNELLAKADIKQPVFYAEFDWDLLCKIYSGENKFTEIPKYPEVKRDLSLVLNKDVKFEQIKKVAYNIERKLLKSVNVFDVYQGDKLPADQKSYSVSFILQDEEKTLNDQQIDKTMTRLMVAFEAEVGAVIRK
ncbi:phenylalanine--tRNA ligase subunit beta [Lacihabitans sp. LS3-19]|uniref:phenylalanine--tRNA ligase subunit beta n=1 Tax=Lacihabitans sp. LS3-19 TaxID=2487335 RepID=UPI0020CBF968|nr:phenylalanine--tRNA ligase subunit beta [Lacihabitans sp. LS3-19]MCP9767419.1 phenylalanine--tRNA ligase subunit beta [Lacihabitans sp. LS3-19]